MVQPGSWTWGFAPIEEVCRFAARRWMGRQEHTLRPMLLSISGHRPSAQGAPLQSLTLLADGSYCRSDPLLVQPYGPHTIPGGPEVQTCHPPRLQQITGNPCRTFAPEEPNRVGHTVLRRHAQAHVNVVCHAVLLQQFHGRRPTMPYRNPIHHAPLEALWITRPEAVDLQAN